MFMDSARKYISLHTQFTFHEGTPVIVSNQKKKDAVVFKD